MWSKWHLHFLTSLSTSNKCCSPPSKKWRGLWGNCQLATCENQQMKQDCSLRIVNPTQPWSPLFSVSNNSSLWGTQQYFSEQNYEFSFCSWWKVMILLDEYAFDILMFKGRRYLHLPPICIYCSPGFSISCHALPFPFLRQFLAPFSCLPKVSFPMLWSTHQSKAFWSEKGIFPLRRKMVIMLNEC